MKTSVRKVGYILGTYPCRSETFAAREIKALGKLGFVITAFAATSQRRSHSCAEAPKIFCRPSLFSAEALLSLGYLSVRYPLALSRLLCLALVLAGEAPRDAVSLVGNLHTIGFFARHLDAQGISHIHACFLSWPAIIALALSVATGRSYSISAHARDIFVEHGALEWKISRASFVTTCTNQGLRYLKVHLPVTYHKKLYLNYHGIELVSGFPVPGGKGNGHSKRSDMVIAVGRLVRKKGFADLLRAFSLVVRERPHSRLMIVGDGPGRQELTALTEQLDLKERVEFMGWQPPDVTLALISHAAVLAVPSAIADDGDRDGIPNVILEAFASGTPVIASRLEGISEAIEHRRTGLGVKPGDIAELAAAIKELLNDKHLQRQLSQKACETAVQRFDSAKNARQLAELFMSVN